MSKIKDAVWEAIEEGKDITEEELDGWNEGWGQESGDDESD